jgi:hypothetical protein
MRDTIQVCGSSRVKLLQLFGLRRIQLPIRAAFQNGKQ